MKENRLVEAMSMARLNYLRNNSFDIGANDYRKVARDACRVGSLAVITAINRLLVSKNASTDELVRLALVVY